jgi:hypothetical protein
MRSGADAGAGERPHGKPASLVDRRNTRGSRESRHEPHRQNHTKQSPR